MKLLKEPSSSLLFCVRPRRMGKSLTLSTIQDIYKGEQELFKNTWIGKIPECEWKAIGTYPVIMIAPPHFISRESFEENLKDKVRLEAKRLNIELTEGLSSSGMFRRLISDSAAKAKSKEAVVLIDEYDRPLMDCIAEDNNPQLLVDALKIMKRFYSVIKDVSESIRFCLITGSAKFAKLGLFSSKRYFTHNLL